MGTEEGELTGEGEGVAVAEIGSLLGLGPRSAPKQGRAGVVVDLVLGGKVEEGKREWQAGQVRVGVGVGVGSQRMRGRTAPARVVTFQFNSMGSRSRVAAHPSPARLPGRP